MLYIEKQPDTEIEDEINRVKRDVNWKNIDYSDVQSIRTAFDQLNKGLFRQKLYKEQKGICVYCMRRVSDDTHSVLEHFVPIDYDGSKALDYQNIFLSCDGGQSFSANPHVLSCDAAKKNRRIVINPLRQDHMETIRYSRNGQIYTFPQNISFDKDINEVLQLNGLLDKKGNTTEDTSTKLVYGRKEAYHNCGIMIKLLQKRNKCTESELMKCYKTICNERPLREYAGVWLFVIRRKIQSLRH